MQTVVVTPPLEGKPRHSDPTMIVMHATAGHTALEAIDTLRERGLSYNFIVEKDGRVFKCLPASRIAFHAGNSYGPNEQAAGVSRDQDSEGNFTAHPTPSVNGYTVGISFVNMDTGEDPYTAAQESAARELIAAVRAQFPSIHLITTHAIVSPRRKVDPLGYDIHKLSHDTGLELWQFKA